MKKALVVLFCVLFLASVASAEYVFHSGKRGTGSSASGTLGDSSHVWRQAWIDELQTERWTTVPLASVLIDGSGAIGNTDACIPYLATHDNVVAIVNKNQDVSSGMQFAWTPAKDYTSGMEVRLIVSSDTDDATDKIITWDVYVLNDDASFPSAVSQTAVALTGTALSTAHELVTLTLNTTADAAITAGSSVVVIELKNSGTAGRAGSTEIKHISIYEP